MTLPYTTTELSDRRSDSDIALAESVTPHSYHSLGYNSSMARVHVEIEVKYDVDDAFELPSLAGLVAGHDRATPVVEGAAVTQRLSATYFDTRDHRLARAHLSLCRRTGGQDAGWHLKVPGAGSAGQEVRLPLGRATVTVPAALRKMVCAVARGEPLSPVATIVTERTVHHLVDATGQVLVEVADDRARAERLSGTASREGRVSTWREIEVELRGVDRGWLDAVDAGLRDLGLSVAEAESKLARVLADDDGAPASSGQNEPKPKRPSPKSPAGDVVLGYVDQQVEQILANDPQVRLDTPGSVHRMRVATRRLRSALQTFKPVLDAEVITPLRVELKWLAGELGAARDAEVLRDRMTAALHHEDQEVHLGPLGDTVDTDLSQAYRGAHDELLQALDCERYHQIVLELDRLVIAPPLTDKAARPAAKVLPQRAARAYARLESLVTAVHGAPTPAERDVHLHEARKAAKKARYAGETMTAFFGKPAARFATAMETLQEELGEHQDSVVMRTRLEQLARQETAPATAFAYGRLHAHEEQRGQLAVDRFETAWRRATKKSLRSWMN
jgi:CHAD domain-containing protein